MLTKECCHKHLRIVTSLDPKVGHRTFGTLRMKCQSCDRYYHVETRHFRATNSENYKDKVDILEDQKALEIIETI